MKALLEEKSGWRNLSDTASAHRYRVIDSTMNGGRLPSPWVAAHSSRFSDPGTGPRIVLIDSWRTAHRHAREYAVDNRCVRAGADGNNHLTWTFDERLSVCVRVDDTMAPD